MASGPSGHSARAPGCGGSAAAYLTAERVREGSQVDCPLERVCDEISWIWTHKWKVYAQHLIKFILLVTTEDEQH